ncbi:methionyl-tRNA synthetase [Trematosphaeria pertusa]|uniref:methionine--tRNA ligase n=1 Tax=Trematosphaeria pertusa TaxID=390896 RepID=A0A6A6I8R4_9PLEO|nr:methionyl-tRNA synthetase [Trematosphaeria pertusa]KAF2246667.1 methionyl-tRNA synthetase [Trematosphaeria pertusa]
MTEELPDRGTVLPVPGKRNILVTSALPYVNNVPHLGNIIGSVLSGDAFARYCRGRGLNTLYIGGTDEYGTTTEAKALVEKCTPQELCDKYHAIHSEIYKWFNISFDIFGRTTTQLQTDITQDIFLKLDKNGFLKERVTTQLYCQEHHSFLADRFVEGECPACGYQDARGDQCDLCGQLLEPLELKNPRCKVDGSTPMTKDTKHIFLELDKLQPEIATFFQQSAENGTWTNNGKHITSAWLKEGLQPRSITRDMRWGTEVPLPGYQDKVIYSWFDACIGYVSITAQYTDQWEKWWRSPQDVQLHQFIGKDNVVYHSVIFPGSQIGTGETWTKLHHLSTTDYLTYEGGKFSKSRGIGVFGDSAQKTGIPSDVWRYHLLSHRPETGDSEFTWDSFISSNNNLLLKNIGNFVNRVLKFVNSQHCNNVVPDWTGYNEAEFDTWKREINELLTQYIRELDAVKLRSGLSTVLHISQQGNAFLQSNKLDNSLALNEPPKCATVVGLAINLIHLLASIIAPYMPETANSINRQLRMDPLPILDHWDADSVKPGHEIGKAEYLFSRIKPEKAEEWRKRFGSEEAKKIKEEEVAMKARKSAAMRAGKMPKEPKG